jgi:hypothetical protein
MNEGLAEICFRSTQLVRQDQVRQDVLSLVGKMCKDELV